MQFGSFFFNKFFFLLLFFLLPFFLRLSVHGFLDRPHCLRSFHNSFRPEFRGVVLRCGREPHDHLESESLVSEEEESEEEEEESELELLALRRAGMEWGSVLTLAFSTVEGKHSHFISPAQHMRVPYAF